MLFASIYVPDFPWAALVRSEPEWGEQALAVVEGAPPVERVVAVNEKAAQAGVEPGMTRVQAAERIAEEQVRRRSPEREAATHAVLLDCAWGFSPRVEDRAADTVLLDLEGLERVFGPPAKIAGDIHRRCAELGLEANIATASNPDAALHAARGFPGVTVIPPGEEAERLGRLPVDVLMPVADSVRAGCSHDSRQDAGVTRQDGGATISLVRAQEILDTLDRWGIRTLRALAALSEVALTERLGQEGLLLQRLARGATLRPLVPAEPPLQFEEVMELEYAVEMLEPLAFVLNRLLEQLCARLAARSLATTQLTLRLELDDSHQPLRQAQGRLAVSHQPSARDRDDEDRQSPIGNLQSSIYERTLRLPVPMLEARTFLKLLQLDLQAHPPAAPVIKVWLAAEPAQPRRAQHGLFLPLAPEPEKLELTLRRIAGVVGGQKSQNTNHKLPISLRVGSPELLDSHRPDAFRMTRFAPPLPTEHASKSRTAQLETGNWKPETATLALRLFRPPLRAVAGLKNGQPARLACNEKPSLGGDVVWAAGPWRTSGDWQEPQPWDREEWDIAVHNEAGVALFRIFRDVLSGSWFVEGSYD